MVGHSTPRIDVSCSPPTTADRQPALHCQWRCDGPQATHGRAPVALPLQGLPPCGQERYLSLGPGTNNSVLLSSFGRVQKWTCPCTGVSARAFRAGKRSLEGQQRRKASQARHPSRPGRSIARRHTTLAGPDRPAPIRRHSAARSRRKHLRAVPSAPPWRSDQPASARMDGPRGPGPRQQAARAAGAGSPEPALAA